MRGGLVLDDLQRPDARALLAPCAQEQPTVRSRPKQNGACCRQICLRVEIFGDTGGVPENDGIDVIVSIDIDTPGMSFPVSAR